MVNELLNQRIAFDPRNPIDGPYIPDYHSPQFWVKGGVVYMRDLKLTCQDVIDHHYVTISGWLTDKPDFPNFSEWTDEQRAEVVAERLRKQQQEQLLNDQSLAEAKAAWETLTDAQRDALEPFMDRDFWR